MASSPWPTWQPMALQTLGRSGPSGPVENLRVISTSRLEWAAEAIHESNAVLVACEVDETDGDRWFRQAVDKSTESLAGSSSLVVDLELTTRTGAKVE